MDVQIRIWDSVAGKVLTQYFDSRFFRRSNAENLTNEIFAALKPLDCSKMIMLSMDGPYVNWLVLEKMKKLCNENGLTILYETGRCGLHVVHGAFQTGFRSSGWALYEVMRAIEKRGLHP